MEINFIFKQISSILICMMIKIEIHQKELKNDFFERTDFDRDFPENFNF